MHGPLNVKELVDFFYARNLMNDTKSIYGKSMNVFNVKHHNAYS